MAREAAQHGTLVALGLTLAIFGSIGVVAAVLYELIMAQTPF